MKRYLLFGGEFYYPFGGMEDFKGDFESIELAVESLKNEEWWHIFDSILGETVKTSDDH